MEFTNQSGEALGCVLDPQKRMVLLAGLRRGRQQHGEQGRVWVVFDPSISSFLCGFSKAPSAAMGSSTGHTAAAQTSEEERSEPWLSVQGSRKPPLFM